MNVTSYTNAALVRAVDANSGTPLECEMAERLSELQIEVEMLNAIVKDLENKIDAHADDMR